MRISSRSYILRRTHRKQELCIVEPMTQRHQSYGGGTNAKKPKGWCRPGFNADFLPKKEKKVDAPKVKRQPSALQRQLKALNLILRHYVDPSTGEAREVKPCSEGDLVTIMRSCVRISYKKAVRIIRRLSGQGVSVLKRSGQLLQLDEAYVSVEDFHSFLKEIIEKIYGDKVDKNLILAATTV